MIKRAISLCRTLVEKLAFSLRRFPETVVLCILTTSILIVLNHGGFPRQTSDLLQRLALILALGIPITLCLKMLFEKMPHLKKSVKGLMYTSAALLLVFYYFFMLKDLKTISMMRYAAFTLAFYLAFSFIPYFYRKENYELYVITLFSRFFVTYIYSLVLFAGLAAIIFTINQLFSVSISSRLYFDIWLVVVGVFAPAFFLADIPQQDQKLDVIDYSKVLKVLLLYIVMPIIVIYTAILYAFFAKILITLKWPVGIVSHLVLWYSIISTLVIFLVYPLRNTNQWVKVFISFLPKMIIPLLAMMFVAMGIRIKAFGITESRYLVLVAGLWVTGSMIYYIFIKEARNIMLAISLALITVLTVVGPWSSFSISKLSQNMRLEKILKKYDMVKDKSIIKPESAITPADKKEISSILTYFSDRHDLSEVKYIPKDFTLNQMEEVFGFELSYWNATHYFNHNLKENDVFVDIKDYDYFIHTNSHMPVNTQFNDGYKMSFSSTDNNMKITKNGIEVYSKNVADIATTIHKNNTNINELGRKAMTVLDQGKDIKVLYVFKNFGGNEDESIGQINIDWMDLYIFLKSGS